MTFKRFFVGGLFIALVSCTGKSKLKVNTAEIDTHIAAILKEDVIYDVAESMRFSKLDETYEVVEYTKGDTLFLHAEIFSNENFTVNRNIFYLEGLPVYITEYFIKNTVSEDPYLEREIYLNGKSVIAANERSALYENNLELEEFTKTSVSISEFDFERPKNAVNQTEDYQMRFGEFLVIDPQTYLILENKKSGYAVALFVSEEHALLNKMHEDPNAYQDKIVFTYHQFFESNGIARMAFIDAVIVQE